MSSSSFVLVLVTVVALTLVASVSAGISCRNDKNEAVDWFAGYKMPYNSSITDYGSGYLLAYLDPSSVNLTLSPISMADPDKGAMTYTLKQLDSNTSEISYVLYNDETPDEKTSSSKAHAKGVVILNAEGGIWLVHSTPRYPNYVKDGYQGFPDYAITYGQTFLCMTLGINEFTTVSQQLQIDYTQIYDKYVSASVEKAVPAFKTLSTGGRDKSTNTSIKDIKTVGGQVFTTFAKSSYWGKNLYDDLVAPRYKQNLLVETWGRPLMNSTCKPTYPYNTMNVLMLAFYVPGANKNISFAETKDHSKWAVSTTKTGGALACIGDINRMESQQSRGGGTVCTLSNSLHHSLHAMVAKSDNCP